MADTKINLPDKKRGVLLICFSEETLGALVEILQQAGESCLTPPSLHDAWICVKNDVVGCVVLDLTGPAADAASFLRACRSSQKSSHVPFLFLVSNADEIPKLDTNGPELSHDSWLVLPSSAEVFLSKTRMLLEQKGGTKVVQRFGATKSVIAAAVTDKPAAAPAPQPEELLSAQGSVFAGKLGVLDVTKIISMIEPLRLTGVLTVSDGKRMGLVHFIEGAVRHSELHDIEGADALFLLFHLKNGAFRFDLEPPTQKRTIEGNTMSLLLEGLRQMDEAKAIIKNFQQNRATAKTEAPNPVPAGGQ